MITLQAICERLPGLEQGEVERWLSLELVRPALQDGELLFAEVDVARVRLIWELRRDLEVEEPTLPLVLSLMDQLYATRRELRRVLAAMDAAALEKVK